MSLPEFQILKVRNHPANLITLHPKVQTLLYFAGLTRNWAEIKIKKK